MNIFFSSDFHYNHKNTVRGTSTWGKKPGQEVSSIVHSKQNTRDFDTLEEHDDTLVNNINNVIKANDILYFLGDWSFNGIDNIWKFRRRINCKTIHFVLGNHDHHIANNKVIQIKMPELINIQSLFSSVNQLIMNKKIGGQSMCLSHFAQRVWDKGHHGNWHLYGHSHNTLSDYSTFGPSIQSGNIVTCDIVEKKFKCMDVGVDTHPEFRPYHFDEIAAIMKNRVNLLVDHHNPTTN